MSESLSSNDDDSITDSRGVASGGRAMRHGTRSGTCYITATTVTMPAPSPASIRLSTHPSTRLSFCPSVRPQPVLPLVMLLLLLLPVAPSVEADSTDQHHHHLPSALKLDLFSLIIFLK